MCDRDRVETENDLFIGPGFAPHTNIQLPEVLSSKLAGLLYPHGRNAGKGFPSFHVVQAIENDFVPVQVAAQIKV